MDFLTIYIKEAHPEDGWQVQINLRDDVCYKQPTTLAERVGIANDFKERFEYPIPLVVDRMDNAAEEAFAALPERLYIIGADGKVAYKGGVGPFNFEPKEVVAWLQENVGPESTSTETAPPELP